MSLAGALYVFWVTRSGKNFQVLLDHSNRLSPKSHELDPNPYIREAIAYFASSLDFNVRLRQAKSEIYDRAFRKMCRSIHEHAMKAEVGRADRNFPVPAFIAQMELGEVLNTLFATSWYGSRCIACALLQERTPSVTWSDDPE
jgi:hypothetical protein